MERVKREFADACAEYHKLPNRPLQNETYCAFMETYRVCMKDGNGDGYRIYRTETEEQYLTLVIDEKMWVDACDQMKRNRRRPRNRNVDVGYLDGQLKNNAELKGMINKLAICLSYPSLPICYEDTYEDTRTNGRGCRKVLTIRTSEICCTDSASRDSEG